MSRREGIRLVLCGFVAGVVWHLLSLAGLALSGSGLIEALLESAAHSSLGGAFSFGVDIAMGVWAVWLYSAIAPRYGSRFSTIVITGTAWWTLKTLQSAKWAGLGFIELRLELLVLGALSLIAAILAAAVGGRLYDKVAI